MSEKICPFMSKAHTFKRKDPYGAEYIVDDLYVTYCKGKECKAWGVLNDRNQVGVDNPVYGCKLIEK